jgi:hypothetical protein
MPKSRQAMWSYLRCSRLFWKFSASYFGLILFTAFIIGGLVAWHIKQTVLQEEIDGLRAKSMLVRELAIPALDRAQDPAFQMRMLALGQEIGARW